jgi:hypothetical protein
MKKILITALLAALTAGSSFAQGQVGFGNTASNAVFLSSSGGTTKMFGSAGTYDFGLYMGSAGTTSLSGMQLVALALSPNATTSTIFNAGLFSYTGGTVNSPGNVANTLNFAAGTQYAFFVAGWAASAGSYDNAITTQAYNGISALGFITPVSSPTPIPSVFGTAAGQIGSFTLVAGPEPATIAIGGLGAAALLLFRRRK